MKTSLSNSGSVEDIRASLRLIDPQTPKKAKADLQYLEASLSDERAKQDRLRLTVIKMITAKINHIKKEFEPWLNGGK